METAWLTTEEDACGKTVLPHGRVDCFSCGSACGIRGTICRVIPKGTLSIVENGKPAGEFQSEVPVRQGSSLVCSGESLVQGEKFQLIPHDKAEFSLAKNGKELVLTAKSGTVEFSMGEDAGLAFVTPKDKY